MTDRGLLDGPPDAVVTRTPCIVQVPPPRSSTTVRHFSFLIAGLFGTAAILIAIASRLDQPGFVAAFSIAAALLVLIPLISDRIQSAALKRFFARHPDALKNPLAQRLADRSSVSGAVRRLEELTRAHVPNQGDAEPAPLIVCLGGAELPEVGSLQFEPEVITPTRLVGREVKAAIFGGVLVTLFLVSRFRPLPGISRMSGGAFAYFFMIAIGGAVIWLWRSMIRPRYVRLAPGMIQILEFGFRRQKPKIRSYPMTYGTVVCISGAKGSEVIRLRRNGSSDQLALGEMSLPEETRNRIWEAILSTAPTPPLSDEGLVG